MTVDFLRTAILGEDFNDDVCAELLKILSEVEELRTELENALAALTELVEQEEQDKCSGICFL